METYISILRGINVGGHKLIKMQALTKLYEDLGFKNVKTYIQSGNVVFQTKQTDSTLLEEMISKKMTEIFTFEVPIIVKLQKEIAKIHKNNPFIIEKHYDINLLHVTFLSQKPKQAEIAKITGDFGNDEYIISDKAIYLYCPNGYGNTKLTNTFFENKLKVSATTRNWKTTTELINMSLSIK